MASGVELPAPSKLPHIVPRTIPGGSLQPEIRGAMDWGWQGLLAYSCNYTVVVIDPLTQQLVQTLDKHKALVTKVKWQRSQLDARFAYRAVLASADASGHIVIWDVKEGFFTMVLQDSWRPVSDMSWVYHTDGCGHMLLAAHPPNSLVLWDTDNGNKLWKKTYNEQLLSFDLDPFDPRKLALLCPSSVLMVDDFAVAKCPSSGGTRVQLSALRSSAGGGASSSAPTTPTYDEKSTKDKLKKKVLDLVTGDIPGPEEAALGQQECVHLSYHRARRHLLLLVFGRQVLLVDTQLGRAVGAVPADKSGSPFTQVMSCSRADALLTVCESGAAAVRTRAAGDELSYESRGHTDAPRLTRHLRLSAAALDPASEARLAVLLSDGRSLLWELGAGGGGRRPLWPRPPARLLLAGLLTPGPAAPTVLRMCPPLTTKNWQEFVPRLACGTAAGALLVLDVARGCVLAELAAHSAAVAGIEWCSLTALLSWARPAPAGGGGGGGGARSELLLTDVRTGQSIAPRAERADSEPIGSVRVSPLKQYFIVVFREQPAELWELSSLTQLRALPASLPPLTALEWSPVHSARRRAGSGASETDGARALAKEHFVFTDPTGQMYHFSVEGNQVRDGTRIPADPAVGTVTGIGWKGEQLVLGDAEGQLCIWDLAKQLSHTVPTHRGAIRKLKFAPGRGNMKLLVLFADGVDIWDTRTDQRLSQLRSPRDGHPVHDCDWVSSDKPVLLTADNCVRVMDLELRQASSPTDLYQYREPVCHPCLMSLGSVSALEQYLFNAGEGDYTGDDRGVCQFLQTLPADLLAWLRAADTPPEQRGLVAAHLLGNESAARLWRLACHHLGRRRPSADGKYTDFIGPDFDLLCDSEMYLEQLRDRVALRLGQWPAAGAADEVTRQLVALGQPERAAQLLLETEPADTGFYTNCLRACVLTSGPRAGDGSGVAKLVATSLIAAGHVHKGVEILVVAGQAADGCRYLQASGLWEEALLLARCRLAAADAAAVIGKHADHLISVGREREAVLFLISAEQFPRAAELVRRRDAPLHRILETVAARG
ncbi:WD repeat-containing protein 11-like [Amphibalanus amphitrite]|uniref:WD repeat-containing protein 11-like n=1 Tax=Amphibalanus amphitrite TaxID=1232801 RepID=UPI001C924492|nr:WD repeat-containing protein 11-like [Amphibalanus amphitrite]